jgi:hypothetical protein
MGLRATIWSKLSDISALPLSQEGVALFELLAKVVKLPVGMNPDDSIKGRKLPFASIMTSPGSGLSMPVDSL